MSIINKLLGKSDAQIRKEKFRKEIDKKARENMSIAEYYAILGSCKNSFEKTIRVERLNVLERREKKIGDASQKSRIHDAAVGLVAIEEAEIALKSAAQVSDMADAKKKLGFVIRQLGKLDPNTPISKQNLKSQMDFDFDDTGETEDFIERASLVDEQFVEYLIQGYSMEECMDKKLTRTASGSVGAYDFTSGDPEADAKYIDEILRKNVDKR